MKHKSKKELEKMSAKRLLAYYKSVRSKTKSYVNGFYCECCGTPLWELYDSSQEDECLSLIKEAEDYMDLVKSVLNTKEHVKRKK